MILQVEVGEHLAGHQTRRDLGDGHARRLGNEGHRATGARVHLDQVDLFILHRILHIHQAQHVQGLRQHFGLAANLVEHGRAERIGGQGAGAVAGMNARFFDMLHDAGDMDIALAIAKRVDIHLDGVLQITVEQHRARARHAHGLVDVTGQRFHFMDQLHGPAAEYIGGSDQDREAELLGGGQCLLRTCGDRVLGLAQFQIPDQFLEALAVFCQIDGVR